MEIMMQERLRKLEVLRRSLGKYEPDSGEAHSVPSGHYGADTLISGLRIGSLHEVYAEDASHAAAAVAFAAGLAHRLARNKSLFWVGTDFSFLDHGLPNASGFLELGLDPQRLILLRMASAESALRAASDILSCGAVGALVIEIEGSVKRLDLTASRRLSLAASQKNVSVILLRLRAEPHASSAETRWLVRYAASSPLLENEDWGSPRFDVRLLRNRHGTPGQWIMEWDGNHGFFRQPDNSKHAAHYSGLAAPALDRPIATEDEALRAG